MESALEDVEFLSRSEHRVEVLEALADGPGDRDDLRATTGASDPTIGRIVGDFESRGWAVRDGGSYALTKPGAFVAEHFSTLLDRMDTERSVRAAWEWLPSELDGFDVNLLADAVVTTAEPGDPYRPVNRCASLAAQSARLRGFDAALTAPHHVDEFYQRIVDGLETAVVVPPAVSRNIGATYPERAAEVLESGHLALWLHDELPLYRLTVFEDRVGIGGYNPETGVLQVYVDTDAPAAREWAVGTFESYRAQARRLVPEPAGE